MLKKSGVYALNRKRAGGYVTRWDEFEFLPGAKDALRLLTAGAHRVIVVTNQRAIALGYMTAADLAEIHDRMTDEARDHLGIF